MIKIKELTQDSWGRVRALRIAQLIESPESFSGNPEEESLREENYWREKFLTIRYLVAIDDDSDIALVAIENLEGDFGATCWIGWCWTDPDFRNQGILRTMISFIDANARANDWGVIGLGVWTDNEPAIMAYEKLGFVQMGDETPSTNHPGRAHQRMIRGLPAL